MIKYGFDTFVFLMKLLIYLVLKVLKLTKTYVTVWTRFT